MSTKEDVVEEVEAVQAVYGEDCVVFDSYPPFLHVYIKPRTADVTSQQFVEAVIGIRASSQYPEEPPHIDVIDSKGLNEQRQKHLITCIEDKANKLSSCSMLVALCEEAVEQLSSMNHPDGNCPLCLYPLVSDDNENEVLPFMKLMSCFHCFHSECIIRWWNWIQIAKENGGSDTFNASLSQSRRMKNKKDTSGKLEASMGNCPICRKVFHAKDLEHVLHLIGSNSYELIPDDRIDEDEKLLLSDLENNRRQKFEALLTLQKEKSGLIESKNIAVVPGMFLPQSSASGSSIQESVDHQQSDSSVEAHSSGSSNGPTSNRHTNAGIRRHRGRNSRQPVRQWIRKENSTGE